VDVAPQLGDACCLRQDGFDEVHDASLAARGRVCRFMNQIGPQRLSSKREQL
jgi:hypothetical protein